jgi:NADH dehydrogenase FAD-containing subunit
MVKRVVIIGGGPAGLHVADGLRNAAAKGSVEVIVIERKDHFDVCVGAPRCLVNGAYAEEVLISHDRVLNGQVKQNIVAVTAVTAISPQTGMVSCTKPGGHREDISADAIVIATGSSYRGKYVKNNDGLVKQDWLKRMAEWRTAASKAKHILLLGGGVTGVEVAGELAMEHPSCKVTLVHSGQYLCNRDKKLHDTTMSGFSGLPGTVEVITQDKVVSEEALSFADGPRSFRTLNGKEIRDVDMVLVCTGASPNTSFLGVQNLDARGFVVVDNTLQAPALTTEKCPVFAVGDCTHCGYGRYMVALQMAKACTKNLLALAAGKPLTKVYDPAKKDATPIFASLGRKQGVATLPFVNKFLARLVKAPSLMVGILYPNEWKIKGFKLSPAAMGPSPLVAPKTSN